MATVAFLGSMVDKSVAAAAARASLQVLQQQQFHDMKSESGAEQATLDISKLDVKTAVNAAVGAAATRAKQLAEREERETLKLAAEIVGKHLKRVEVKIRHFERLEEEVQRDRDQIERMRLVVAKERVLLQNEKAKLMKEVPQVRQAFAFAPQLLLHQQQQQQLHMQQLQLQQPQQSVPIPLQPLPPGADASPTLPNFVPSSDLFEA